MRSINLAAGAGSTALVPSPTGTRPGAASRLARAFFRLARLAHVRRQLGSQLALDVGAGDADRVERAGAKRLEIALIGAIKARHEKPGRRSLLGVGTFVGRLR
jgi:anti-sigma factor RsiW